MQPITLTVIKELTDDDDKAVWVDIWNHWFYMIDHYSIYIYIYILLY